MTNDDKDFAHDMNVSSTERQKALEGLGYLEHILKKYLPNFNSDTLPAIAAIEATLQQTDQVCKHSGGESIQTDDAANNPLVCLQILLEGAELNISQIDLNHCEHILLNALQTAQEVDVEAIKHEYMEYEYQQYEIKEFQEIARDVTECVIDRLYKECYLTPPTKPAITQDGVREALEIFEANQYLKSKTHKDDFLDNLKRDGFWVHDNLELIRILLTKQLEE